MEDDLKCFDNYIDFRNFMLKYKDRYEEYMRNFVIYELNEDFIKRTYKK